VFFYYEAKLPDRSVFASIVATMDRLVVNMVKQVVNVRRNCCMDLGVVGLSLSCLNFTAALDFIQSSGGNCLELCTVKGAHRGTLDLDPGNRAAVAQMVRQRGLRLVSVAGYNDFTVTDQSELRRQVERLNWYCELAADLDVGLVRVMSGDPPGGQIHTEHLTAIAAGMKMTVKRAAELDIVLALENHGLGVNDAELLLHILEAVNSERLKITLDTGNFGWAGHNLEDTYRYFEMLSPYVANVHLKDLLWLSDGQVKFVPLGQGTIDFKKLLMTLKKAGYQGALLCEYEGAGEPKELIKAGAFNRDPLVDRIKEGTRASLDYIRSFSGTAW
jgi:sugar phosphate isomerase/epimerase